MTVALPDVGVLCARLPILLKVQYEADGSTADFFPPLSLVGVSVSVKARTSVRTRAGQNRLREDHVNNDLTISVRDRINIPLEPGSSPIDLSDKAAVILASVPISFISHHIKCSYRSLSVLAVLQCGQKRQQVFLTSSRRFTVLSPLYFTGDYSDGSLSYFSPVYRLASSSVDDLPQYEGPVEESAEETEPLPSYEP